jgi:hypothetical protein
MGRRASHNRQVSPGRTQQRPLAALRAARTRQNDIEANRASYAVAFVNLGPELPDAERDYVFDRLLPLATEAYAPTNAVDAMEKQFRNPLGSFRITGGEGRLRRYAHRLQC